MSPSRKANYRAIAFFAWLPATCLAGNSSTTDLVGCDWFNSLDLGACDTAQNPLGQSHDVCKFDMFAYPAIGMKNVERTGKDDPTWPGTVWTQGGSYTDSYRDEWQTDFLLSWSKEADLGPVPAKQSCAFMFKQENPKLAFPGFEDDIAAATGTCPDAIDQECIDQVIDLANKAAQNESLTTANDICLAIWESVTGAAADREKSIPACAKGRNADFSIGEYDTIGYPVTYDNDLERYNGLETDSPCYPSMNDYIESYMTLIGNTAAIQNVRPQSKNFLEQIYRITPLMLVSWADRKTDGKVKRDVSSSLTCMKLVDTNHSVETSLRLKKPETGGSSTSVPGCATALLCLALAMFLVF